MTGQCTKSTWRRRLYAGSVDLAPGASKALFLSSGAPYLRTTGAVSTVARGTDAVCVGATVRRTVGARWAFCSALILCAAP